MTPLQMATRFCSNWEPHGCEGINLVIENGQVKNVRFRPSRLRCLVSDKGVRCVYFEECVMPMRCDKPHLQQEIDEAVRTYRMACNISSLNQGRKCSCGRELEPRKQFCYVCKKERRREKVAAAVRKHRNQGQM